MTATVYGGLHEGVKLSTSGPALQAAWHHAALLDHDRTFDCPFNPVFSPHKHPASTSRLVTSNGAFVKLGTAAFMSSVRLHRRSMTFSHQQMRPSAADSTRGRTHSATLLLVLCFPLVWPGHRRQLGLRFEQTSARSVPPGPSDCTAGSAGAASLAKRLFGTIMRMLFAWRA